MTDPEFMKFHDRLLRQVSRATMEAAAIPVAFLVVYAEPAGQDTSMFHYRTSCIGSYFRDKAECFTDALIKGVNDAVITCFEAEPADDYKVYHA